jgi:hypothetical protein
MLSSSDQTTLALIMLFYAIVSYVISPGLGYLLMKKKEGITYGIIIGSIVSILLWFQYGQKLLKTM